MQADLGGIIGIDAQGNVLMEFHTPAMTRGAIDTTGNLKTALFKCPRLARRTSLVQILLPHSVLAIPPGHWSCPFERSEEHTSELQSQSALVCRLLL